MINDISITEDIATIHTLTFELDKTPTKAIFIPTIFTRCTLNTNEVSINGKTVTVSVKVVGVVSTNYGVIGGYLLYK